MQAIHVTVSKLLQETSRSHFWRNDSEAALRLTFCLPDWLRSAGVELLRQHWFRAAEVPARRCSAFSYPHVAPREHMWYLSSLQIVNLGSSFVSSRSQLWTHSSLSPPPPPQQQDVWAHGWGWEWISRHWEQIRGIRGHAPVVRHGKRDGMETQALQVTVSRRHIWCLWVSEGSGRKTWEWGWGSFIRGGYPHFRGISLRPPPFLSFSSRLIYCAVKAAPRQWGSNYMAGVSQLLYFK